MSETETTTPTTETPVETPDNQEKVEEVKEEPSILTKKEKSSFSMFSMSKLGPVHGVWEKTVAKTPLKNRYMRKKKDKTVMVAPEDALPGREEEHVVGENHAVNGNRMKPPFPDNTLIAIFGMGNFWAAEKKFWGEKGVYSTQVGYTGGFTPNPTYDEVATGKTGHALVVRVIYNPEETSYYNLLRVFWENHNPTQGMQQGGHMCIGTQYRSGIYYFEDEQKDLADTLRDEYQGLLTAKGHGEVTTEVAAAPTFYYAEDHHQQFLHKHPRGFNNVKGLGINLAKPEDQKQESSDNAVPESTAE